MGSSKDREKVRLLAQQYGMLESDIREMLAFEEGKTQGDVVEVEPRTRWRVIGARILHILACVVTLRIPR